MFLGLINIPSLITFLGLILAVFACLTALEGDFALAMVCLMYSGLCDLFDGLVARKMQLSEQEQAFGMHLDSVVDMASFGMAPVIVAVGFGLGDGFFDSVLLISFVCCAAMRLAYFNLHGLEESGRVAYYSGLPVTFAALIIPVVATSYYFLALEYFHNLMRVCYVCIALLFVLKVPVPKPQGVFYILFPLISVLFTFFYLSQ
ncbi:MAG: hypothetical protein COB51_05575 [Moraxellaceae bacterium]|nr:MAG: hypothetical protein COB51_05575 [Moraxellaceae bacterium]